MCRPILRSRLRRATWRTQSVRASAGTNRTRRRRPGSTRTSSSSRWLQPLDPSAVFPTAFRCVCCLSTAFRCLSLIFQNHPTAFPLPFLGLSLVFHRPFTDLPPAFPLPFLLPDAVAAAEQRELGAAGECNSRLISESPCLSLRLHSVDGLLSLPFVDDSPLRSLPRTKEMTRRYIRQG